MKGPRLRERMRHYGPTIALGGILLGALALRLYRLDHQSLWADEGNSAVMAGRGLAEIIANSAVDIHPPLYYIFLHWSSQLAGPSEYALRLPSVIWGVLLALLVYKLAERLFDRPTGLIAAGLAAVSPYLIYYSQEARMYMQMAALAALSTYLFIAIMLRYLAKDRPGLPLLTLTSGYVLASSAALYTQYFSFAVIAFHDLTFALAFWRVRRHWRLWLLWLAGQAALALLYLPWLARVSGHVSGWEATGAAPLSLAELARVIFRVFALGRSWSATGIGPQALMLALLALGIAAVALLAWRRRQMGTPALVLQASPLLWLVVPLVILWMVTLRRPLQFPEMVKQVITATPAFYLLLGVAITGLAKAIAAATRRGGLARSSRLAAALAAAALIGATGYAVHQPLLAYFDDPAYARDDYRSLARFIEMSSNTGDSVILYDGGQREIFDYYYRGGLAKYALPRQRPVDEAATRQELEQIAGSHQRLWLVMWGMASADPSLFIQRWLGEKTYRASHRWFGNVQLSLYTASTSSMEQAPKRTVQGEPGVSFGGQMRLASYRLEGTAPSQDGVATVRVGDVMPLTLFWQADRKPEKDYTVFTHLIDRAEYIWGQHDSPPAANSRPTSSWASEETVADHHGLQVWPGTPPGDYYVEVGAYDPATGVRLPVQDEGVDRILLGPIRVESGPQISFELVGAQHRTDLTAGELRLEGYNLTQLGPEEATTVFPRGSYAHLTLFWTAVDRPQGDYQVLVRVLDSRGDTVIERRNAPAEGNYPAELWEAGELVRDQHRLQLDIPAGEYTLSLGVLRDGRVVTPKGKPDSRKGFVNLARITVK